jgi:hypothetical protein
VNSIRRGRLALALLSLTSASSVCAAPLDTSNPSAETTTQDRALAEALFRDGKALVESEHLEEACTKFQESQRLEPALGTLLYLATCYAQTGKTASAWAAFQSAEEMAHRGKDTARESLARERGKELEARLSRVTISISSPVRDMKIRVDDRVLGPGVLSTPLPFDPGSHVIEATAPGKQTWSTTIDLEPGPVMRKVEIPTMQDAVSKAPIEVSKPEPFSQSRTDQATSGFDWRLAGLVTFGVGLTGVVAGSYFGARAYSQAKDADHHCVGRICSQQGLDGYDSARRSAVYSNIGFGVGIVGLAAGTYLIVFHGSKTTNARSALWIRAGAGQVVAGGAF